MIDRGHPRRLRRRAAAIALVCVLLTIPHPGLGRSAPAAFQGKSTTVQLREINGSGMTGLASVTTNGGTDVSILVTGSTDTHAAHIHHGFCEDLSPDPVIVLSDVDADGISKTTINVPMPSLLDGGYAIDVHRDAEDASDVLACGEIATAESPDGTCPELEDPIALTVDVEEVTYRQRKGPDGETCEQTVTKQQNRTAGKGDSVNVDNIGRAVLVFEDYLKVTIFRRTELVVQGEVGDGPGLQGLQLAEGSVHVEEDLQNKAEDRVRIETDGAVIEDIGTTFFAYYGSGRTTWVIVIDGEVTVRARGKEVVVREGWQTWVVRGQPPEQPRPATRSVVEDRSPNGFPRLSELTNDYLKEKEVFAHCRVADTGGTELRSEPSSNADTRMNMPFQGVFAASTRTVDGNWLFGRRGDQQGWALASAINCPYEQHGLPIGDGDRDGAPDDVDNCVNDPNPKQLDSDGDDVGNDCDDDRDGDGSLNGQDNCRNISNPGQADSDGDGMGDACDATPYPDNDSDGSPDARDNCPYLYNQDQTDSDGDGVGNACDANPNGADGDGDGVPDVDDNCPNEYNPGQADSDFNNVGDACDATDSPPSPPSLSLSDEGPGVTLNWTESSDDHGIGHYEVYRNDSYLASTAAGVTDYTDDPECEGTYDYFVRAVDTAGQPSAPSNTESYPLVC